VAQEGQQSIADHVGGQFRCPGLWFLVFGVGAFVYLAYYAAKQDSGVYLSIDQDGALIRQGNGATATLHDPPP
jgi:hypothetical protein